MPCSAVSCATAPSATVTRPRGKRIAVIGPGAHGIGEAIFVARTYSSDVTLLTLGQVLDLDPKQRSELDEHGIKVVHEPVVGLEIEGDRIAAIRMSGGEQRFDVLYSAPRVDAPLRASPWRSGPSTTGRARCSWTITTRRPSRAFTPPEARFAAWTRSWSRWGTPPSRPPASTTAASCRPRRAGRLLNDFGRRCRLPARSRRFGRPASHRPPLTSTRTLQLRRRPSPSNDRPSPITRPRRGRGTSASRSAPAGRRRRRLRPGLDGEGDNGEPCGRIFAAPGGRARRARPPRRAGAPGPPGRGCGRRAGACGSAARPRRSPSRSRLGVAS